MTTRLQYRTNLNSKLLAMEDGGYGDFDYENVDLNFFIAMAVARMFPAVYKRLPQLGLSLTGYGSNDLCSITPLMPERVFLIEDAAERVPVLGWHVSGTDIVAIDPFQGSGNGRIAAVNIYYYDGYTCPVGVAPADDELELGIPAVFEPLIQLGALIEACEARQDTGVRGDPAPIGQFQEMPLLDRLNSRYDKLLNMLAMSMPVVLM